MRVLFRVDASLQIGSGHVARCLTLADAIVAIGGSATFVCREHEGHLGEWIHSRGHQVQLLNVGLHQKQTERSTPSHGLSHASWLGASQQSDANQTIQTMGATKFDWLVLDHYAIDATWQQCLRRFIPRTLVIDDLADRDHLANLLLDQNFRLQQTGRYEERVPADCQLLLGPTFALLRPQFAFNRSQSKRRDHTGRLMIFMGGMDEHNVTTRVLQALGTADVELPNQIHAIIGAANPHHDVVASACDQLQQRSRRIVQLHVQVSDMAAMMATMDLAIAAGGTNTWERCCLGIPTATIAVAENQIDVAEHLDSIGVTKFLGQHDALDDVGLSRGIKRFLGDTKQQRMMRTASLELVDGQGPTRIVETMNQFAARRAA